MTYADSGVEYEVLDRFKREAQQAARGTAEQLLRFGLTEVGFSRGESVYLIETPYNFLAHVEEGLGTKSLVADAMYELTGRLYYDSIAQDTVAMIVNDMITLGALPVSVAMHLAVGASEWFNDMTRASDLIEGWKRACVLSRCVWGGGETPTLKGIVEPSTSLLSGSALGIIEPKSRLITANIQDGDAIILLESSGIHANGLTLAREIAVRKDPLWRRVAHLVFSDWFWLEALPDGYLTELSDGRTYGETLLDPTHIYVGLVEDCLNAGVDIHYVVNITGHGWRKLMRAQGDFAYIIDTLPRQLPIFDFITERGPVDIRELYANFNVGAGFALYVPQDQVQRVLEILAVSEDSKRYKAVHAGYIEESKERKVVIEPVGIEFKGSELQIR